MVGKQIPIAVKLLDVEKNQKIFILKILACNYFYFSNLRIYFIILILLSVKVSLEKNIL